MNHLRDELAVPIAAAGVLFLFVCLNSVDLAHAEEPAGVLLAVGDIAKCAQPGSLFEELQELLDFRREDGPKEPFSEAFLELLQFAEKPDVESASEATARSVDRLPGTILALGDLAYSDGSDAEFKNCYDRVWGGLKERTRPVPGNHEYRSVEARPYFAYWGAGASGPGRGYYSFQVGGWHIVALNSNIDSEAGSAQLAWLRQDLAETEASCILAYWHHPVFSSGKHGDNPKMRHALQVLYENGVSVVLSGHDHDYERFAPQNPDGLRDDARGFRQFVVGTGGAHLRPERGPEHANSRAFSASNLGVLKLELFASRYHWRFLSVDGPEFSDAGEAPCVARTPTGDTKG